MVVVDVGHYIIIPCKPPLRFATLTNFKVYPLDLRNSNG